MNNQDLNNAIIWAVDDHEWEALDGMLNPGFDKSAVQYNDDHNIFDIMRTIITANNETINQLDTDDMGPSEAADIQGLIQENQQITNLLNKYNLKPTKSAAKSLSKFNSFKKNKSKHSRRRSRRPKSKRSRRRKSKRSRRSKSKRSRRRSHKSRRSSRTKSKRSIKSKRSRKTKHSRKPKRSRKKTKGWYLRHKVTNQRRKKTKSKQKSRKPRRVKEDKLPAYLVCRSPRRSTKRLCEQSPDCKWNGKSIYSKCDINMDD